MTFRDLKNRARRQLHDTLSVPAVYVAPDRTQTECTVRVHRRTEPMGDMTGFDYQPAERIEQVPEIVVLAEEVTPSRGGVFSVAPGEAYRVETPMPMDGITITSQVSRLTAAQAAGLPVPD